MASDPISEYQHALQEFEQSKARAERLVNTISDAADKLRRWTGVNVSNTSAGFPIDIINGSSINGKEWPSGEELAQALSRYHSTFHEAGNAYRRIPANQRQVVQPPPLRDS